MRKTFIVAWRNLVSHLHKPSFYLATFGVPLLFGLIALAASAADEDGLGGREGLRAIESEIREESLSPVGYVDSGDTIKHIPQAFPPGFIRAYASEAAGREALHAGTIGSLYVLPPNYRETGKVRRYVAGSGLAAAAGAGRLFRVLLLSNLLPDGDPHLALRLEEPMRLKTIALGETGAEQQETSAVGAMLAPIALAVLFTIAIFMSSGLLLQAVVEEKENRTIELIVSSLGARQFLAGKVLGLGLLGLLQVIIWLALGMAVFGAGSTLLGALPSIQLPGLFWAAALLYFLLGYLLFASLLAGIGAVSTTIREGSQLSALVSLPASTPLFLAGPLSADPGSAIALALSLFPLTAPTAMLMRLAAEPPPAWQIALSLLLLLLAAIGALWFASRLFRAATLLAGKRLALREIGRALLG